MKHRYMLNILDTEHYLLWIQKAMEWWAWQLTSLLYFETVDNDAGTKNHECKEKKWHQ